MRPHRSIFADEIRSSVPNGMPIEVFGFTDDIDSTMKTDSSEDAAYALENLPLVDHDEEFAVRNALKKMQTLESSTGKDLMLIGTDEGLQGVTEADLNELQTLSTQKSIDVVFLVHLNGGTQKLTIDQVREEFNKNKATDIDELKKGIEIRESLIKDLKAERESKARDTQIKENEEEIESLEKRIMSRKMVNVSSFTTGTFIEDVKVEEREVASNK